MKILMRVSLVALLVMSIASVTLAAPVEAVSVTPFKYKHLFVVKVDKKYKGATVEVYYSNGDLVTTQKLERRKMVINFCDTKFGEYTIRVVKGDKKQEFYYVKR